MAPGADISTSSVAGRGDSSPCRTDELSATMLHPCVSVATAEGLGLPLGGGLGGRYLRRGFGGRSDS